MMLLVNCIVIYILFSNSYKFAVSNDDPQVFNPKFDYGTQIEAFQLHWIFEQDRDLSQYFSPDDFFPIEINVPDTVMDIWQGVGSAWTAASDYFSMNGEVQRT